MDFPDIVKNRYSAKKFDGRRVPEETMEKIYEMLRLTPSSYNLQPWKFKIITEQAMKERLLEASHSQVQVTTCSHLIVMCANTDLEESITRLEKEMEAKMDAERLAAYGKKLRDFAAKLDDAKKLAYAQHQVYIALGNALNGAEALGLDACPMGGFDAKKYAEILRLPKNLVPTVLCPIGYSDSEPRPKMRFKKEDLFF